MLRFFSADLVTGILREELPLQIAGDLSRLLSNVGTGSLTLSVADPACPPDWEDLTAPWRTLVVVLDDDDAILWAGIPTSRSRDPLSPVVTLPCSTLEAYLGRRYVPTLEYSGRDQTSVIARGLVGVTATKGIGLTYDTPDSYIYRDRSYYWDEGVTVLQRLTELSAVIDGFEWSIDVEWADAAHTRFAKVFRTGYPYRGRVTSSPNAIFELPGGITAGTYDELWGADTAATHVLAFGDGQGESRGVSAPVIDTAAEAAGMPRLELTRSMSGVTTQSVLDAHAKAFAAETFGGQRIITITARADAPPRFAEYSLGDSVGIQIATDTVQLDEVWRLVGWYLSAEAGTVKPAIARVRTPLDGDWIWT